MDHQTLQSVTNNIEVEDKEKFMSLVQESFPNLGTGHKVQGGVGWKNSFYEGWFYVTHPHIFAE